MMLSSLRVTATRTLSRRATRCLSSAPTSSTPANPEESDDTPVMFREKLKLEADAAVEAEKSPALRQLEAMNKADPFMVAGTTENLPDPVLPDNPAEIAALDPAGFRDTRMADGSERIVLIRQNQMRVSQSPESVEKQWIISFEDGGESSETWENPLMGWVSAADPMSSTISTQLTFRNAGEAVYFAKKRGWKYVVDKPIYRPYRDDHAQYQDNFLPQSVADHVKRDRKQCNHWERAKSGSSHYFRPLTYHGDGLVPQYGTNPDQETDPMMEGSYKLR